MSKESDDEEYNEYIKDLRIPCQYGVKCYQKNPIHHNKYKHPPESKQHKNKKHMKQKATKRKAEDVVNNSKTSPTSPQATHQDKKQNQSDEPISETSSSPQKGESEKIYHKKFNNEDRISPSPEKEIVAVTISVNMRKTRKIQNLTLDDKKRTIKKLFLTEMPKDFYQFYEFCKENSKIDPASAFKIVHLKLVGPFDIMSDQLFEIQEEDNYLKHWRYFYDPPEFQTILKGNDKDELHFGYWRDDPDKMPIFVAKNNANVSCKIVPIAENLFGALDSYLEERTKLANPFEKTTIARLHQKLKFFAKERNITLDKHTSGMKEREKKVLARTLHGAGIVVPFNRITQVGYRKLSTTEADLQKMFKKIEDANGDTEKNSGMTELQEVVRWATIAADECDFGTCLELGHDLFSSGVEQVKEMALQMLSIAYGQLDRSDFLKIAQVHLKNRKKGPLLSCL